MKRADRIEQQRIEACADAARWLVAYGLDAPADAAALEQQLVALDRQLLARAQELQARAERERSFVLLDQADGFLATAQRVRDLRARMLAPAVAERPRGTCPCGNLCPPSKGRGRPPKYCGETCARSFEIERRNDAISAETLAVRMVPRTCAVCGREFFPPARGSVPATCAEHRGRRLPAPTPALSEVA